MIANQFSAYYLTRDVSVLYDLYNSQVFQESLDDLMWLSQNYRIPLSLLAYSPFCVNDAQEREYFKEVGTFRDAVYPMTKQRREIVSRAKERIKDIKNDLLPYSKGILWHKNLKKCFVPWGDFIIPLVKKRFPRVQDFISYKEQFSTPGRQYYLAKFSSAFAEWMLVDYARFFEKKAALSEELKSDGISPNWLASLYRKLEDSLPQTQVLRNSRLTGKLLEPYVQQDILKIGLARLAELVNMYSYAHKLYWRFFGIYKVEPEELINLLDVKTAEIMEDIVKNRAQVHFHEPDYLYVTGSSGSAPLILADEIDIAFLSNHTYYKRFSSYSHEKPRDTPRPNRTLHEMHVVKCLLDSLLSMDIGGALGCVREGLKAIPELDNMHMVFYSESTERYRAFENGKVIYFTTKTGETAGIDGETSRGYFTADIRGKEQKIFVMGIEDFVPDYSMYAERLEEITNRILKPLKELD
ncbi:MAG: hypothetical protein ABIF10_07920 [Candidatus Woesearchaeota archaeon]